MRILIAEDDEALARFVRQGLETEQYSVDGFKDGEQALGAALAGEYACLRSTRRSDTRIALADIPFHIIQATRHRRHA